MNELLAADEYVYKRLTEDTALNALIGVRVFEGKAPEGTPSPFIVFHTEAPSLRSGVGGRSIIFHRPLHVVQARTEGEDYSVLEPICERIQAVLHGEYVITLRGCLVTGSVLENAIKRPVYESGQAWVVMGGRYRVFVSRGA